LKASPSLVFLAYPNNPTGNLFASADIERILAALGDTGIVVDEAYEPFAQHSLWVACPSSKSGGDAHRVETGPGQVRLGYMSAAPALLAGLKCARLTINVLTRAAFEFALRFCLSMLNAWPCSTARAMRSR
jgi:histidinol-phosphate aminotransferase